MNKGIRVLILISVIGLAIAFLWNHFPIIKQGVHFALDPTLGKFLEWNVSWGMVAITALITLITSLLQKYTVDQTLLKEIKSEQKLLQQQMKEFKEHPEKMLELQKKQLELIPKTFDITLRPALYTVIPFILLIRWFGDFFATEQVKIFGFLGWLWAYILFAIIFSMIFRKLLKLP